MALISDRIYRNMPALFSSGFERARIHAKLATINPVGAPSRLGQVDGSVHGLSTGGLQGGGEGVLYVHLHLVGLDHYFDCQIIFYSL